MSRRKVPRLQGIIVWWKPSSFFLIDKCESSRPNRKLANRRDQKSASALERKRSKEEGSRVELSESETEFLWES